jgi:hypothetical protein
VLIADCPPQLALSRNVLLKLGLKDAIGEIHVLCIPETFAPHDVGTVAWGSPGSVFRR